MINSPEPFTLALDALKMGDRRVAAKWLHEQVYRRETSVRNLASVRQLAEHIGEVEIALEAARQASSDGSLDARLDYWALLATYGRAGQALSEIERLPVSVRDSPPVLHFRGTVATQFGQDKEAEALFRRALATEPRSISTWYALAMLKTFQSGDPDITAMEGLRNVPGAPPEVRASLFYGLGKAAEDCGEIDRAFAMYSSGAQLRRQTSTFDLQQFAHAADATIQQFTSRNLGRLTASQYDGPTPLMVTGLPRSGTTLTEQILLGHSTVSDGAEINVFRTAMLPVRGAGFSSAVDYQDGSQSADPWGDVARDYVHLVQSHFGGPGLYVDKSLGQALWTGLMLHALPQARIAWLRRSPEDVALSCFRTYFATGLSWTWSLTDIADYMRAEDRLFSHWIELFPERILVVPYEELVKAPATWAERLQLHFGLAVEQGIESVSRENRRVRTASVGQVRAPISTARIGQAQAFERYLEPFRTQYHRPASP